MTYRQTNDGSTTGNRQASALKARMPRQVWQKMMGYVKGCQYEINGFGYVRRIDESTIAIEDVYILDQTVSGGSAVTEPDALASHITGMLERGDDPARIRFQWHSHVNMQAYFSATDTDTIDGYSNCDWMISLVANKREEYEVRLDIYQPFRVSAPIGLEVFIEEDLQIARECLEEIEAKVKTYAPRYWMSPTGGTGHLSGNGKAAGRRATAQKAKGILGTGR